MSSTSLEYSSDLRSNSRITISSSPGNFSPMPSRPHNAASPRGVKGSLTRSSLSACSFWELSRRAVVTWIMIESSNLNSEREVSSPGTYKSENYLGPTLSLDMRRFFFVQALGLMQRTKYYGVWLLAEVSILLIFAIFD